MSLTAPDADEERVLREAAARLSLHRFEAERGLVYPAEVAEQFVLGYIDGIRGAALERATRHRGPALGGERLAAFAFGWCRGHADLLGHRPVYAHVERWLSRRLRPPQSQLPTGFPSVGDG